jgi:hypothetical protein
MSAGTAVNPKSILGRQFATFAESIVGMETHPIPATRKRRFIEYFATVPFNRVAAGQRRR